MNEIGKYNVLKEKLQGICDENDLTFAIHNQKYPFFMTVKALSGMDAQMSMLEDDGENGDTGYISPEAVIVFAYKDGDLTYKMSETINISDSLFNKIKNLFKKMYSCYMAYYFRDRTENGCDETEKDRNDTEEPTVDTETDANDTEEPAFDTEDGVVVEPDEFADFFDSEDDPAEQVPQ